MFFVHLNKIKDMDKKIVNKLLSYSAVAGAFVATGQSADAQVVYTDFSPDTVISVFSGSGVLDIDLNDDGNVDFQIQHAFTSTFWTSSSNTYFYALKFAGVKMYGAGAEVFGMYSFKADTLPLNEELIESDLFNVNSSGSNLGSFYTYMSGGSPYGLFPGEGDKFVGVRFVVGTDTLYGWIRLNVPSDVNNISILDFAYETQAGVGIHAGDTVGVYVDNFVPSNLLATSAHLDYTPMKSGNIYCIVQAYTDPIPTEDEVISGVGAAGATVVFADTNVAVAETADNFVFSALTMNTQYKAYIVLVDDSLIISNVIDTSFTTLDPTGINYNGISEFNAFPNPFTSYLNIDLPLASLMIIRDLSGREILRRKMEAGHQQMNLGDLEAGTYLIEAISEKNTKVLKIIKR